MKFDNKPKSPEIPSGKVFITPLTGPNEDTTLELGNMDPEAAVNLLAQALQDGHDYKIDYRHADPAQTIIWGRADMIARIIHTFDNGMPIEFDGQIYQSQPWMSPEMNVQRITELEEAIANSRQSISYTQKDGKMVIKMRGEENMN